MGFPGQRMQVIPNFIEPDPGPGPGGGEYALFVGRLSEEKGIATLIAAWKLLDRGIPLKIVGEGPMNTILTSMTQSLPDIELMGKMPLAEVFTLMGRAAFLVMPSECYEVLPRTIIEAYAKGLPVLVSDVGAMSFIVRNSHTGLHFQARNPEDLALKAKWLLENPLELARMRQEARKEYKARYTGEINYEIMVETYEDVIKENKSKIKCN